MKVTAARQIPAGGRLGWFVDVGRAGRDHELFLQAGRGLGSGPSSFQGFEIEAEVYRALRPHGIPVPRPSRSGVSTAAPTDRCISRISRRSSVRSEEHTSELLSLILIPYAVFCLKKKLIYSI